MSEMIDVSETAARLLAAEDILIICHKNPDGDTVGSAGALLHALLGLRKRAQIVCASEIPARYSYMKLQLFDKSYQPHFVVALDLAGPQLFGDATYDYASRCNLCIDHHPTNSRYADALLLKTDAAATAEIIFLVIEEMQIKFTPLIADCLYTGISTDTGCFKFGNTTPNTHRVAAQLMEQGADFIQLNQLLFESKSRSRLEIERLALSTLEYHFNGRCALIYITKEMVQSTGAESADLEGITGIPRSIEGVDVGITIRQQPEGSYKISVRTTAGYDAAAICGMLGGGGHKQASGCEIIGELKNAKAAVLAEVAKQL